MKIFKKVLLVIISILALLILGLVGYAFYSKPQYEGELPLKNIQKETTVYFDEFGVTNGVVTGDLMKVTTLPLTTFAGGAIGNSLINNTKI